MRTTASSSSSKKIRRGVGQIKYKKAPEAPRRFKSSYIFFSTMKHKSIRAELSKTNKENEKMSTTEIAKMVSKAWKTLPEDEREKWEDMAREDKTRYENEKTLYKGPWKVAIVQPEYKITATSRTSEFLSTSLSSESESSSSLLVSSSSSQQVQTQMQMQMQMQNRTTLPRRISTMTEDTTSSNNTATATDTTGVKYYNDALKMKPLLNPSDGDFMDMNMNMNMNINNINNNININSINNIPSSIRINDDSSVYSIASDSIPTESSDCDFKYNTKMASDIFAISNSIPNEIIPHYFNDGTNGSCDELSAASIIMHYNNNNNNNNNNRNNNTQDTHDNQLQQQTLLSLSSSLSAIENYNNGIDYRIGPDNFSPPNQQYRFTSPPYNYVREISSETLNQRQHQQQQHQQQPQSNNNYYY